MPKFDGFVGPAYQAPSIYQDAQECINWYPEVDPTKPPDARGATALYPTPGLLPKVFFAGAKEIRGMFPMPGGNQLLAVVDSNFYTIDTSLTGVGAVGNLATSTGPVSITSNRTTVFVGDGVNRYSYAGGVLTTLSDGGFAGADKVDYVDNFIVYNQPGSNQWGSTSALSTASPALSFSSKDSAPDNIVSLIVDHREVYLLGETTTERWINAGLFPFPFQRIPGTTLQHGCAAKNSVTRF